MPYLQVAVTVNRDQASCVSDFLSAQGAFAVTVESAGDEVMFDEAEPGEPKWRNQRLTALYDSSVDPTPLMSALNSLSGHQQSTIERLADQDWERVWLDQFEPVKVTDRLWVCPSWLEPPDSSAVNLRIDPGMAFGTGTHATTFLCLEQLSSLNLQDKTVVDYGCGSGILAIAALALGAARAYATDIDPRALAATRDNAEKNGVADKLVCALPSEIKAATQCGQHIDVVIANILAGTLIRLQPDIVGYCGAGTRLMLSGILCDQAALVTEAYRVAYRLDQISKADWVLLTGLRAANG